MEAVWNLAIAAACSDSDGKHHSSINLAEEIAAMSKPVDELHNHEDATSLLDGLLFFFGITLLLGVVGILFWSAF
jgi:hypothetical protein